MPRARPLRFFLTAAASFVLGYALVMAGISALFHWPANNPPPGYGTFLLREIPGPRIIVDSGSSAVHSIIPGDLEKRFGRRAIVASDNAGVPFAVRMRRLDRYVVPGDIVIMPLEWVYYMSPERDWHSFGLVAFDPLNDYYRLLGFWRKVELAGRLSGFRSVWRSLRAGHRKTLRETFSHDVRRRYFLTQHRARFEKNPGGDVVGLPRRHGAKGKCSAQLPYAPNAATPGVDEIAEGLARLQREKSITVVVTWPAVAGDGCYDDNPGGSPMVTRIREALERRGIKVIGDPRDGAFPASEAMDSVYHVTKEAAELRTRRLIAALEAARVIPPIGVPQKSTAELAASALAAAEGRLKHDILERLTPLRSGRFAVGDPAFDRHFGRADGWYVLEERKLVWSRGTESTLVVRRAASPCRMKFEHHMLGGPPSLVAVENGVPQPETGQWITIAPGTNLVSVHLHHRNVASPHERGLSADTRTINYALLAIVVACGSE